MSGLFDFRKHALASSPGAWPTSTLSFFETGLCRCLVQVTVQSLARPCRREPAVGPGRPAGPRRPGPQSRGAGPELDWTRTRGACGPWPKRHFHCHFQRAAELGARP